MKKYFIVFIHVGFWACYALLIMIIMGALMSSGRNVSAQRAAEILKIIVSFSALPSLVSFYLFYFFVFPKNFKRKTIFLSVSYGTLFLCCAALVGNVAIRQTANRECVQESHTTEIQATLAMMFIAGVTGVVALVIKGFIIWFREVRVKELLQQKNHEMELALIKSQLDPHFLFNTINNIDVLILKNSTEASNYLNALSDIMRFILYETKSDHILLSREIEYIEKYVALQRIRTANTNYVNLTVRGCATGKYIAPMIFIPFIENAFKHTSNKKINNAIEIEIDIKIHETAFTCQNRYLPDAKKPAENNGLGNDLIRKRLALIYPTTHALAVAHEAASYRVSLTIDHA